MKNTIINLSAIISKEDDSHINPDEYEDIMDGLLSYLEDKKFKLNGGWNLQTEDEYLQDN